MRVSGGRIRAFANFAGAGEPTVSDIGVLAQSGKGWKADPEGNCDRGMTWDRLGVGRREGDWRHCMRAPLRDFTNWGPPKSGVVMIIVKSIAPGWQTFPRGPHGLEIYLVACPVPTLLMQPSLPVEDRPNATRHHDLACLVSGVYGQMCLNIRTGDLGLNSVI